LLLLATVGNLAGEDERPQPSRADFQVIFLGTGGPRPAERAACCNLILSSIKGTGLNQRDRSEGSSGQKEMRKGQVVVERILEENEDGGGYS
jgi:hypothetical protein